MKALNIVIGIFLVSFIATACATGPIKLPEKYNLNDELQEAEGITNFKIDSWQSIDLQSLIIRTITRDYFLIVLDRPAPSLLSSETIGVTVTVNYVKPGFDNIIVTDSTGSESYIIHKMYKLKDRGQAREIRERLIKS